MIARAVRGWVERLGAVWVEAQLIEINRRSGTRTIFLTLRDKLAEVSVSVTTSPTTLDSAGPLTEGATVVARIKPTFYESSGRFIFACDAITPIGEGRLLARLEQTKRLLQAEGLFDRSLKKSLPFLPRAVGLVTGEGSAAERDVMENARRRWPAVRIVTRYALVQGPQACEQLIAAVQHLDRHPAGRRHCHRPRRRLRGRPPPLFRRGPDSRRSRLSYAGGERHRARVRQPDPRSGRRLPRIDTDRCRETRGSRRCRRKGSSAAGSAADGPGRIATDRPPTGAARRAAFASGAHRSRPQHSVGVTSSWPNSGIALIGPLDRRSTASPLWSGTTWRGYGRCRRKQRWIVATRSCWAQTASRSDRSIRSTSEMIFWRSWPTGSWRSR